MPISPDVSHIQVTNSTPSLTLQIKWIHTLDPVWKYDPVASWTSTFALPNCLDQQTCSTWSSANSSPSQDFWSPAKVNRHWIQQMRLNGRSSSTCLSRSALEKHVFSSRCIQNSTLQSFFIWKLLLQSEGEREREQGGGREETMEQE